MSRAGIVERDEISELFLLIGGYPFKPYSQYSRFDRRVLADALCKEIETIAADRENYIIAVKEHHQPVAVCIARKSGVESEVFNKKIYAITHVISAGSYVDSVANKQKLLRFFNRHCMRGTGMVSCRANAQDLSTIHALENERYRCMDTLVTYTFDLNQFQHEQKGFPCRIRPVQKKDGNALKDIVRNSQFIDRFHNDPHISRKDSNRLYETFIGNAMKGMGADMVLVAECDDKVVGFNTIESQNSLYSRYGIKIGSFVLNAVAPEYRNRGIYTRLIQESLQYLKDSADLAELRTHSHNLPVHRALPQLGFRLSLSQLTFHAWNTALMPAVPDGDVK
ncbi:MAG: GNAT family N-acetyltransferase [Methanoregula sp.]|nr:GNAT family N-acetyltransferase [Methanoregula sp.]